jgi:hypothetical protein
MTIYISYIDGNDANPGTREKPVRSLDQAIVLAKGSEPQIKIIDPDFECVSPHGNCIGCPHEKRCEDESREPSDHQIYGE